MATRGKQAGAAGHPGLSGSRASYRDVLGVGEFRSIFAADIVSMLGTIVAAVALTVLIYERTRSPPLAASVMPRSFVPFPTVGALLGPPPGPPPPPPAPVVSRRPASP